MAFLGHLIKINGVILPSKYINVGTYRAMPEIRRKLDEYYTQDGVKHERYSSHTTSEITFATNGMKMETKNSFLSHFPSKTGLATEYYDDAADEYKAGVFDMEDLVFERYKIRGMEMLYKPVNIVLRTK